MYSVLLVDDDPTIRFILKRYKKWEACGFYIKQEAANGKDALETLGKASFDLVITDIKMPIIDGLELLEQINLLAYDNYVVLASTYNEFEYARRGLQLGALDYLLKPIYEDDLYKLLSKIKLLLDEKYKSQLTLLESTKNTQEALKLYSPLNSAQSLLSTLLTPDVPINEITFKVFDELNSLFDNEPIKLTMLLQNILTETWAKLCAGFPWLEQIEQFDCKNIFSINNITDLENSFLSATLELKDIVEKYELSHQDSLISRACKYLVSHIEKDISMDGIAYELNISKDYFGKLFKQKTGISFSEYSLKIKMEYAKKLLRSGRYKNYEISELLGYSTPDYFAKLFKNHTHLTPLQYKKSATFL